MTNRNVLSMISVIASSSLLLALSCQCAGAKPPAKPASKAPATKPAAAAHHPGGHLSGALNAAYTSYINKLRGKLDSKWYLADGKNRVTLTLNVDQGGSVTDLKIVSTPANTQAEQAASDAFNGSQPLEALPSGSPPIKLTLVFESYADPHGDNNRSISGQIDQIIQPAATPTTDAAGEKGTSESK